MKKRAIVFTIIAMIIMTVTVGAASGYGFYKKMVKRQGIGKIREYYTEKLTAEILENRGDDIIIEKIIGTVINKKKDGKIMGAKKGCDYITYKHIKGVKKGDTVLTICIYTPNRSGIDDVCERFDYIIDRK